jgi:hypothetical protein
MDPKNISDVNEMLMTLKEQLRFDKSKQECYLVAQEVIMTTDIERKQNAEVLTPLSLVNEMMSKIPEEAWTDMSSGQLPTIFDPCVGKGAFVVVIYDLLWEKLEDLIPDEEERRVTILEEMIYFADINPFNIHVTKMILDPGNKYKLNAYCDDTLQMEFDFKFDIVVGNPPYSTNPSMQNTKPLYNLFIEKYITHDKLIFVVPTRWFAGGKGLGKFRKFMMSRNDIYLITVQDDATKWFGKHVEIKGGVVYFLKDGCYSGLCNLDGVLTDLNKYDIIPKSKYLPLIEKVQGFPKISDIYMNAGYYKIRTNDKKLKPKGKITCLVSKLKSNDRKKYVDVEIAEEKKSWKVVTTEAAHGSYSGFGYMNISPPDEIYTDSYIGFKVDDKKQAESLLSYLKTKFANVMLASRKISQHINSGVVKWIPLVPLDRKWNNQRVYDYFNLTKNEIDTVKA